MNFFFYATVFAFCFVCLILILLVLIQKGRGGGLASAFGGSGGSTAFGTKTGDVLTWATSIVFGVFLLLAVTLNLISNARQKAQNEHDKATQMEFGK
ncbi:MAG TPA: preprotein translocase subunit SecG [Humisphaera sp.]|nr:preprotein translocase subunit SecG [Humisphaera sp.]